MEASTLLSKLKLDFGGIHRGVGILELEAGHDFDQNLRDDDIAIPLVIGRDDEPRGMLSAGSREQVFIACLVLLPELALSEVALGKLPMLIRSVDTGTKPRGLLLLRDMKEEFEDDDIIVGKHGLKAPDVIEALADCLRRK